MANLRTITTFKSALKGGGARPNLFEVSIPTFPVDGWDDIEFNFMCKAAALPASNMAPIEVPFRGRIFKVAGDRTFDTWTVTIINDEDFLLRTEFEKWMNLMSKLDNATGVTDPAAYMVNANVYQLGRGKTKEYMGPEYGNSAGGSLKPLRTYEFWDIFPTNVSAIDLSYDTSDTIEEYTVEFQVQYWTVGGKGGSVDQAGAAIS